MYRSPLLAQFSYTPWGAADDVSPVAPGIYSIGTPSHGGFHVASDQLEAMPPMLRAVGAGRWFEEDCACAAVVLAFPSRFEPKIVEYAAGSLERWYPKAHAAWIAAGRPTAETGEAA
jgi:hypothetical protein